MLVNIILDLSLAYGLTTRPRANTIIDSVTYLVDGTLSTVVLGGVLSHRGRARRRAVVLSARVYILHIHTRPTVAWDPPPGGYRARAGSRTENFTLDVKCKGKGLINDDFVTTVYEKDSRLHSCTATECRL